VAVRLLISCGVFWPDVSIEAEQAPRVRVGEGGEGGTLVTLCRCLEKFLEFISVVSLKGSMH